MVTDLESYNGFPQINHRPLVTMDGCSKRCEKNVLDIMDHFKCSHEIMYHRKNEWMEMMSSYNRLLSIYACLKSRIHRKYYDITLIQFLFYKSTGNLKECVTEVTLL